MALITWNKRYSVNIDVIDKQHMKLIELINDLNEAMKERKTKEILLNTILRLSDYTVSHFQYEEKLFKEYNYPETEKHKKEHDLFIKKVDEFKHGFDSGELMLSVDIITFLMEWLVNHIQITDKKYISLFHEKGLK